METNVSDKEVLFSTWEIFSEQQMQEAVISRIPKFIQCHGCKRKINTEKESYIVFHDVHEVIRYVHILEWKCKR